LQVGVGEAVTSMLQKKGVPGIVQRTLIRPPSSQIGPITPAQRATVMAESGLADKYGRAIDRRSAHEILTERAKAAADAAAAEQAQAEAQSAAKAQAVPRAGSGRRYTGSSGRRASSSQPDSLGAALGQALLRELGGTTGKRIVRGILGGLFKGR